MNGFQNAQKKKNNWHSVKCIIDKKKHQKFIDTVQKKKMIKVY